MYEIAWSIRWPSDVLLLFLRVQTWTSVASPCRTKWQRVRMPGAPPLIELHMGACQLGFTTFKGFTRSDRVVVQSDQSNQSNHDGRIVDGAESWMLDYQSQCVEGNGRDGSGPLNNNTSDMWGSLLRLLVSFGNPLEKHCTKYSLVNTLLAIIK